MKNKEVETVYIVQNGEVVPAKLLDPLQRLVEVVEDVHCGHRRCASYPDVKYYNTRQEADLAALQENFSKFTDEYPLLKYKVYDEIARCREEIDEYRREVATLTSWFIPLYITQLIVVIIIIGLICTSLI